MSEKYEFQRTSLQSAAGSDKVLSRNNNHAVTAATSSSLKIQRRPMLRSKSRSSTNASRRKAHGKMCLQNP